MSISRRNFLTGSAACAVAALPAMPDAVPVMWSRNVTPTIFEGAIGTYQGVIIREAVDLRETARRRLVDWYVQKFTGEIINGRPSDLMRAARGLAPTCHPRITPYGTISETVLEGVECDGDS